MASKVATTSSNSLLSGTYHVWFHYVDPFLLTSAALLSTVSPTNAMKTVDPLGAESPPGPAVKFILNQITAHYLFSAAHVVLVNHYCPEGSAHWRWTQFLFNLANSGTFVGCFFLMGRQGRISPAMYTELDWFNWGVTVFGIGLRCLYFAGVGVQRGGEGKSK